ncbi:MAG: sigma 54-interacting transcriptional regulator [Betaproteobacteria bacterium]
MPSVLSLIQQDVQKYTDAISGIIDTDVEIVDVSMVRVAGTGVYRERINEDISGQGYVYRHAAELNKTILIENPGDSPVCSLCTNKLFCTEKLDLATPISLDDKVIGVIGIICSTAQQRDALLGQKEKFVSFIEQIASLIAGKAYENIERQREKDISAAFRKMIEVMNRGVVAIDEFGLVRHSNLTASRILQTPDSLIGKKISIEMTGDVVYDQEEAYLRLNGASFHVLCHVIQISSMESSAVSLIVFQDAADFLSQNVLPGNDLLMPGKFIGNSPAISLIKASIKKIAVSNASVLISGESGSGKEVVASEIHRHSLRKAGPYVTINCAAIPEQLLESELFGYVKGAFSGADPKGRVGKFEQANGGTIFLDEIGDMPVFLQAKLMRVLQERTITRIGSNQVIPVDVRLIAATNKDIAELIENGQFREDLYYRINVVPLALPPLRERREDIFELANYFVEEFCDIYGRPKQKLSDEIANALYFYPWPGNVRELRNAIEHMFVMCGDSLQFNITHLPYSIQKQRHHAPKTRAAHLQPDTVAQQELQRLEQLLERHGSDLEGKKKVADEMGIGIATLYRKLKKYKLAHRDKQSTV